MISKKDITKIAKRVLKRQKGLRDHQMIHPQREWLVGLSIGFVLFAIGSAWSAQTYISVSERNLSPSSGGEVQQTVYRTAQVEAALERFRDRKDTYDQLLENRVVSVPTPVDEETEVNDDEVLEEEPPLTPPPPSEDENPPSPPDLDGIPPPQQATDFDVPR